MLSTRANEAVTIIIYRGLIPLPITTACTIITLVPILLFHYLVINYFMASTQYTTTYFVNKPVIQNFREYRKWWDIFD